jgi:hypothetical protein
MRLYTALLHLVSHFGETPACLVGTPPVALMGGTLTLWPGKSLVKSVLLPACGGYGTFRVSDLGLLHAVGS